MRIGFDGSCSAAPGAEPQATRPAAPPPTANAAARGAAVPAQAPDSVNKRDDGVVASTEDWFKDEWTTVAGAVHGLMSAPGVVSQAYLKAAKANTDLGDQLARTLGSQSPKLRQAAIEKLGHLADGKSSAAEAFASRLEAANRIPRIVESIAAPLDRGLSAAGRSVASKLDAGIAAAPKAFQGPLRSVAGSLKNSVAGTYASVKGAVEKSIRAPDPDLEAAGTELGKKLDAAAKADSAEANGLLRTTSRVLGTTVGDLSHSGAISGALDKVPFLRDTPVVGMLLAGAGSAIDAPKVGVADATVANVGSTLIGTAAGTAVTGGLASLAGGSLAADGLGVAAATGPVGWAVAGGVVAGAAIGYGAYKAIESQAGQDVIDGIANGNGKQIVKGVGEAGSDIVHIGQHVEHAAVHAVSHFVSDLF
jgi:hypothetical protein